MSEANDELISAFVDGRLSAGERTAFEGQMQGDAHVRQQVQVMRLVIHTASQLTLLPLPRSFVLPASMAMPEKPARAGWDLRLLFRLGSAMAAALFVLLVGLDLSQVSRPMAVALTPNALATFAPESSLALSTLSAAPSVSADGSTPRAVIPNTVATKPMAAAPANESSARLLTATPAPSPLTTRLATVAPLTPVPTLASVVTLPTSDSRWPLTRVLAGVALIIGATMAMLGWRRQGE